MKTDAQVPVEREVNQISKTREVMLVYAVSVVIFYTWALAATIKDFSRNWILYLTAPEIAVEFAYILTGVMVECLLILAVLFAARFLIPPRILKGGFVLYGSLAVAAFGGWLMFQDGLTIGLGGTHTKIWRNSIIAIALILAILGKRIRPVKSAIESFADRCVVFLYIYLPLSLIALIVVVVRNI